jgi:peptidyl-prolyl cis-trans isomerase C
LRSKRDGPVQDAEREVLALQVPSRMTVREQVSRLSPARFDSRPRCQPLQTITVVWAIARERIAQAIVWDANVPHLGMQTPVQQPAIQHGAPADAGADSDIDKIGESARRAPAMFRQGRGVHVGIERDRHTQGPADCPGKIAVPPTGFRRRRNVAEGGRFPVRIDGPERCDSDGRDLWASLKELDSARDSFIGLGGGKLGRLDVGGPGSHGTNKLGSSGFDSSETWHGSSVSANLRRESQPATIKATIMKSSVFPRVFAISGLAAFASVVALAQQPGTPAPPKPATGTPGTAAPFTPAVTTPAPQSNVAPDAVVLTIGERKITRAEFDRLLAAVAPNAATPAEKKKIAERFGELETFAAEARKRKLDDDPEIKEIISIQVDNVLAGTLNKKVSDETQLTDLDIRAYYNSHKDEFEEAQGSHILIRFKGSRVPLKPNEKDLTEPEALAKAQEIRAKIVAGGDFAALAKAESDDTGSASQGGDLKTFKHGQMVKPFDEAAFALPVGQVSEPVRTDFGYHIIKITSRTSKTFEEAKPEIEKKIKPTLTKLAMDKIKAQTTVTLNEDFFGK